MVGGDGGEGVEGRDVQRGGEVVRSGGDGKEGDEGGGEEGGLEEGGREERATAYTGTPSDPVDRCSRWPPSVAEDRRPPEVGDRRDLSPPRDEEEGEGRKGTEDIEKKQKRGTGEREGGKEEGKRRGARKSEEEVEGGARRKAEQSRRSLHPSSPLSEAVSH